MKFIVSSLIIVILIIQSHQKCGFDLLKKPKRVLISQENESSRTLLNTNWTSIKIQLDYSMIENNLDKINKKDFEDLKEKIMPKTKKILESLLSVKRLSTNSLLKLNSTKCEDIPIPEEYRTEGVDADLVLFVQIDTTNFFIENKIEAAAIHCLQDSLTHRPIAGYIQFKPDLKINDDIAVDYLVWLALHELSHVLVFNDVLFRDFINDDFTDKNYSSIVTRIPSPERSITGIKSENVLKYAKKHFGCENITGIPLEYNGGAGTVGGHWSKKYMNTDYMIGDSYGENLISNITLGLFEDSGWYMPNYTLANIFLWGKDAKCNFFNTSMKCVSEKEDTIVSEFKDDFCTKLNYPVCSRSNIFRGNCRGRRYGNLSPYERYFKDESIGGADFLTDKCPIPIETKHGRSYYGGSCRVGTTDNINKYEKVCPNCACMMGTIQSISNKNLRKEEYREAIEMERGSSLMKNPLMKMAELNEAEDQRALCIEYECDKGELYVILSGDKENKVKCNKEKEEISFRGYKGKITCPDPLVLCDERYKCKFGCTERYE